ncbi:MAG TPA: cytochrome c oxidase subunit II [Terriglobales bacterium]|jgi:cytochrome c oxidase subunit 2
MGLALLVVIWLITFVSTYFFAVKTWWMPGASASAPWIDHQFTLTLWLMGIVFVAAQVGLGWFAWKYRDRPGAPPVTYSHGNTTLEAVWTTLTAILFVGLNLMGSRVWASERFEPAKPGSIQVEATGAQFAWYFRYPGADGTYAPTQAKDISAEEQNPLGMDMMSADAKDDVVSGVMYLPVNREVDLTLRAQDVIHSLFIPAMRFKQDAVPGLAIHMHFTPVETGDYEIACAELCGLGHYKMHGMLKVVSQEDFDKWLASKEAEKQ